MSDTQVYNGFTDLDIMPFGEHKNKYLKDVPTAYLHWAWHRFASTATGDTDQARLGQYIRRSLPALKKENPDLIW